MNIHISLQPDARAYCSGQDWQSRIGIMHKPLHNDISDNRQTAVSIVLGIREAKPSKNHQKQHNPGRGWTQHRRFPTNKAFEPMYFNQAQRPLCPPLLPPAATASSYNATTCISSSKQQTNTKSIPAAFSGETFKAFQSRRQPGDASEARCPEGALAELAEADAFGFF